MKLLLGYLPQNNNEDPPQVTPYDPADRMDEELNTHRPGRRGARPTTSATSWRSVFDRDSFLEIHPAYAPNAVVGFARLDGYSVGIVANQPAVMAGVLDIDASDKIARFIRICDVYNIPIDHVRGLPGLPARDRPGVPGRDPPRRQDHLRLLRGDGPEDLDRHPQGDGRRLRGDGVEARCGPTWRSPGRARRSP